MPNLQTVRHVPRKTSSADQALRLQTRPACKLVPTYIFGNMGNIWPSSLHAVDAKTFLRNDRPITHNAPVCAKHGKERSEGTETAVYDKSRIAAARAQVLSRSRCPRVGAGHACATAPLRRVHRQHLRGHLRAGSCASTPTSRACSPSSARACPQGWRRRRAGSDGTSACRTAHRARPAARRAA